MDQKVMWDYYQGESPDTFAGAAPRLSFLVKNAINLSPSPKGRKILNIGVGGGFLEQYSAKRGMVPFSLDPSEVAIQKLAQKGFQGKVGYIQSIPYEDEFFDFVFCSEVLEHLTDGILQSGISEINRVLVPGAYLIGTVPYSEALSASYVVCPSCTLKFHRWGHEQSFNKAALRALLQSFEFKLLKLDTYSFQSFAGKDLKGKARAIGSWMLGRLGITIANPSLFFVAQKRSASSRK